MCLISKDQGIITGERINQIEAGTNTKASVRKQLTCLRSKKKEVVCSLAEITHMAAGVSPTWQQG